MMDIRALGYILVEATDTERCQLGVRFCARSVMGRWASRAGCKQVAALYERGSTYLAIQYRVSPMAEQSRGAVIKR